MEYYEAMFYYHKYITDKNRENEARNSAGGIDLASFF